MTQMNADVLNQNRHVEPRPDRRKGSAPNHSFNILTQYDDYATQANETTSFHLCVHLRHLRILLSSILRLVTA